MKRVLLSLILALAAAATASAQSKIATVDDAAESALKAGAVMPSFELKDAYGKVVKSSDLLKRNKLVVVFYRGSWCPFCNAYLHKLQTRLADIKAAGGELVAISVEPPDASMAVAKKNELNFTVLSDPNLDTARRFGIVYQLPAETDEQYKKYGIDVAKHNAMTRPELPLGATYVVNRQGGIIYAYTGKDYKKRAEPEDILAALKK